MTTISWTNGVSGDWSDAADWTPHEVPDSTLDVVIGPGISTATDWIVNTTTSNELAAGLLVATGGFGTLSVAALLDVAGAAAVANGAVVLQTGATFAASGALTLGQFGASASSGTLTVAASGLVAALSLGLYDGSTLAIAGGSVAFGNAMPTAGELTVGANTTLAADVGSIQGNVGGAGTIEVLARQSGDIAGTLTITGTLAASGSVEVDSGGTLSVGGDLTLGTQGTLALGAGASLSVTGALAIAGMITATGAAATVGQLDVSGNASLDGGSLTQTGPGEATIDSATFSLTDGAILSVPLLLLGANYEATTSIDLAPGTGEEGGTIAVTGDLTIGVDAPYSEGTTSYGVLNVGVASDVAAAGLALLAGSSLSIAATGSMTLGNASATAGAIAVGSDATLSSDAGSIDANVMLDGALVTSPVTAYGLSYGNPTPADTLTVSGTVSGQGTVALRDGLLGLVAPDLSAFPRPLNWATRRPSPAA